MKIAEKKCVDNTDMIACEVRCRLMCQFRTPATDTILRHFRFPRYFQLNFPRSMPGDTFPD